MNIELKNIVLSTNYAGRIKGLVLKKDLEFEQVVYIVEEIFKIDLSDWFEDFDTRYRILELKRAHSEEYLIQRNRLVKEITDFLEGNLYFNTFLDNWGDPDNFWEFDMDTYLNLLYFLKTIEVI